MPVPFNVSGGGGHGLPAPVRSASFFADALAKTPPGLALLAKEQKAEKRQAAGKNPSVTPGQVAHAILNATGLDPKALLRNAAVVGSNTLPPQAGVRPQPAANISAAGVPIFGPGAIGHGAALGILPFKRLARQAVEEVAAKESPAVPEFAQKIHPRAKPKIAGAKTLPESVVEALKGSKQAYAEQLGPRREENARRFTEFGKALQENPSVEGAAAASKLLAGKYPALDFQGFKDFSPEAHAAMIRFISDKAGELTLHEPKQAIDALAKLREGMRPAPYERKVLLKVFGPDTTAQMLKSVSWWRSLGKVGINVANIPRSIQSSFDASAIGRQALLAFASHPVMTGKNVPSYLKAIRSQKFYDAADEALRQDPFVASGRAEELGIKLTEMSPQGTTKIREEAFPTPYAEKIPIVGHGVRGSGRGYTLFLNQTRVGLGKLLDAEAQRQAGREINRVRMVGSNKLPRLVKETLDPEDPALKKSIGQFANSATGRGEFQHKTLTDASDAINLLLYSPRLFKSRIDFLNPLWYARLDPIARHEAYRAVAGLTGMVALADSLAYAAGAGVNLDPRSSDFAKIRLGNTRVDLAGGFIQYTRILAEAATQQTVTQSGAAKGLAPFRAKAGAPGVQSDMSVLLHFLRGKTAPITSGVIDVGMGQNVVGQPVNAQNLLLPRLTPLAGQDAVSVGKDTGSIPFGVAAFLGSAAGVGVQNYKPKQAKAKGSGFSNPFNVGGSSSGSNPFGVGR
jgi:hypothetical protein